MEQEISEQSEIFKNLISKYIVNYCVTADFPSIFKRVKFIASGSSSHCAYLGARFFKKIAETDADCEFASEFLLNKNKNIDPDTIYFFISQSGETSDVLAALKSVKALKGTTFALTNNIDSTISKAADFKMEVCAGLEKSIAATKSFSASVFCTWLCALKLAQSKSKNILKYIENIHLLPIVIDKLLANQTEIDKAAKLLSKFKNAPVVGYGYYYELAKEGALKIKETSYVDANAYALGEFLHGHVAILNQKCPIVEIFTDDIEITQKKNFEKVFDKYSPKIIAITDVTDVKADHVINFPKFEDEIMKIMAIMVILQLLAFKTATHLKRDVDNPTGLDKVVKEDLGA